VQYNHPKPSTTNIVDSTGFQFKVYFSSWYSLQFFVLFWQKSKEKIKNETKKKKIISQKIVKSQ